jgi:transcriptional regulator with XRE-family HTH domain
VVVDTFSSAIKALRTALGTTQIEFAIKLGIGGSSVAHYETGHRRPDGTATARLCRLAHQVGRTDLAEIFVATLPGVQEAVLVPIWRLAEVPQYAAPSDEGPSAHFVNRVEKSAWIEVPARVVAPARKTITVQMRADEAPTPERRG